MQESTDFARLQEEHAKAIQASRKKIEEWEKFNSDYAALQARLCTLPDRLTHEIMVPFGRFAFIPGQLYHTNEVTVLLGDNWFLETTVKHALEIVERRKAYVCEMLDKERKQLSDWENRHSFTKQFQSAVEEHQDTVEIKEEYTPRAPGTKKERKAWVPKGNVPPPRKVVPPSSVSRRSLVTAEALSEKVKQLSVEDELPAEDESKDEISRSRITVTHAETSTSITRVEELASRDGEPPLYFTPGEIVSRFVCKESENEPVATTTKQVKWGQNQYSDEGSHSSQMGNPQLLPRPRAVKPFTGQVVERTDPVSAVTFDPTRKRASQFKLGRTKK